MNMDKAVAILRNFQDTIVNLGLDKGVLYPDPVKCWNFLTTYSPDQLPWELGLDNTNDLQMTQEEQEAEDYLLGVNIESRFIATLHRLFADTETAKR